MAISFKTAVSNIMAIVKSPKPWPILLRGRHGIGKSELVYQIGEKIGLPVVEQRMSQKSEGDLMGLPKVSGNVTTWLPPNWYNVCCENPCILFLDEIDRAIIEVRQGCFELGDSRKLNGFPLHPETLIFGAVNSGVHSQAAFYQVGEMDPAELDRWVVMDVDPTVQDWLDYANDRVMRETWNFINQFGDGDASHLEHGGEFEPNKVYPSRRSWIRLDSTLQQMTGGTSLQEIDKLNLYHLAECYIGYEAATAFADFVEKYEYQVKVSDILVDAKFEKLKGWNVTDYGSFVEKMIGERSFKDLLTQEEIQNLAVFLAKHCPYEIGIKVILALGNAVSETDFEVAKLLESNIARLRDVVFSEEKNDDFASVMVQMFTKLEDSDDDDNDD